MAELSKQKKYDKLYLDIAFRISEMSHAVRKKVGSVCVKEDRIISYGWNGTPSGFDNNCEVTSNEILSTKLEVMHAEQNTICKLAKHGESSRGSTLYTTLTPCFECAKLIIQAGIVRVVYLEEYPYAGHSGEHRQMGKELLKKAGIPCDLWIE